MSRKGKTRAAAFYILKHQKLFYYIFENLHQNNFKDTLIFVHISKVFVCFYLMFVVQCVPKKGNIALDRKYFKTNS